MDALSEVLKVVKLQGALFFNGEFSSPWCFRTADAATAAQQLAPGAERVIIYHYLTEGRAYARLAEGGRVELSAGDIVIFPHGDAHFVGNGVPEKPVDSFVVFADTLTQGLKAVEYGGGGEKTKFVCGYMACESRLSNVFLAGLPRILRVHVADGPSGDWLRKSILYSAGGLSDAHAGGGLVIAKLSELLFVETLRGHINSLPPGHAGWLGGARDPVVSRALALLHQSPAHPWTLVELARKLGVSRTRFVERFQTFLGESPMAYLTKWRVKLGAEMLESSEAGVAEIAASVGYGSEAAFNRAFRREFGCPPAQFRRARKVGARS
jgi:AraC-like DNA-binding protein